MKVENVAVVNFEGAIRASKFPMCVDTSFLNSDITDTVRKLGNAKRGTAHDNFLNGILVVFDLTLTNKAWTEFQRYHFAEIVSSQSTMHRITKFDLDKCYNEYVDERIVDILKEKVNEYNVLSNSLVPQSVECCRIHSELLTKKYLEILYSNPSGMELTAQIVTNYGQLKTMYTQRHQHKLPEWREFCKWILTLPKFTELTGIGDKT